MPGLTVNSIIFAPSHMKMQLSQRFVLLFLLICGYHSSTRAQSPSTPDSLRAVIAGTNDIRSKAELYRDIANYFIKKTVADSSIYYGKRSLAIYEQLNDKKSVAKVRLSLGTLYAYINDYAAAENLLELAAAFYEQSDDIEGRSQLNNALGSLAYRQKQYDRSVTYYTRNINYGKEGKKINPAFITTAYQGVSHAYIVRQQYGNALNINTEYIDFVEKHYPDLTGHAYQQMANLYRITGQSDKCIAAFQKSKEFFLRKKDDANVAISQMAIGTAYVNAGKPDSATAYLEKALKYYRSVNDTENISNILNPLSAIAFEQKNYKKAEELILNAIDLIDTKHDSYLYHTSFLWTIRLSRLTADSTNQTAHYKKDLEDITQQVTDNFEKVLTQQDQVNPNLILHNYRVLATANKLLGNYNKAYDYYNKAIELRDSIYGTEKLRDFSNKEAELELVKERNRVMLEEETKRLQLQKEIELKALRFEFEKKQAAAKSEEERKRLLWEEELKRRDIESRYEQEQQAITLKFEQEKEIARINQEKKDAVAAAELSRTRNIRNMSIIGGLLALVLFAVAIWSYLQKKKDNKRIAIEKQKSDDLLLNILPYEVAEELKANGQTAARLHEEVTVLFTDFVNFTANAEKIGVQALLNELNICFTAFDKIIEQYGLEKIKTIGDAYLAVSGLPSSNPQHAANAVNAALDIAGFIEKRKAVSPTALDIRIGINSGNVIAGIVGVKKFAYDIWGDTVNTAARMEQNSEVGKVNISDTTYQLVKEQFHFTSRGKISTKGKGEMEMYFVHSKQN